MQRLKCGAGAVVVPLILAAMPAPARADAPIQWMVNAEAAVARARRENLPLFIYVAPSGDQRREAKNWIDAHKKVQRDPEVVTLVHNRFVPLRLQRHQNKPLFARLNMDPAEGMCGAIATPELEPMAHLSGRELFFKKSTLRQLAGCYRRFRERVYRDDIRPALLAADATPKQMTAALEAVQRYLVLTADEDVARLLQRDLPDPMRARVYDTLAVLSTATAAEALLESALSDRKAAAALQRCHPGVARDLAYHLNDRYDARHLAAYRAICQILKIRNPKSEVFWKSQSKWDADQKPKEIQRVRELAAAASRAWHDRWDQVR